MPREVINPTDLWDASPRSYSHVVKVTNPKSLIFVAGSGAVDENFKIVSENIKKEVFAAGADLSDICDMTVYLWDIDSHKWPVREARAEFFESGSEPVSTMVQVSKFAIDGMLIEIDVIAAT